MADNMRFYKLAQNTPEEAKKLIQAGRLKGMTDVNPMFRIKRLTEIFGPCGLGWWYDITDKRIVDDEITGQRAAFVDINLFYRDPETGEVSHAIPGTGGSVFVAKERNGPYMNDECFKMALTDAISVAAKAIGVAADVYYEKDRTKYTADATYAGSAPQTPTERREEIEKAKATDNIGDKVCTCTRCGKPVKGFEQDGKRYTVNDVLRWSNKDFKENYCYRCYLDLTSIKASKEG